MTFSSIFQEHFLSFLAVTESLTGFSIFLISSEGCSTAGPVLSISADLTSTSAVTCFASTDFSSLFLKGAVVDSTIFSFTCETTGTSTFFVDSTLTSIFSTLSILDFELVLVVILSVVSSLFLATAVFSFFMSLPLFRLLAID